MGKSLGQCNRAIAERLEERQMLSAVLVKDIDQSAGSADPNFLVDVNGTLFFAARNGSTGNELWKSDGTAQGTVLVKDINPGFNSSNPEELINVGGTLFFWAVDATGIGLWKSDGTEAGTILVARPSSSLNRPAAVGQLLYFMDSSSLWRSDGTTAGTFKLTNSFVLQMTSCNGMAMFSSNNQLWRSDGTVSGTTMVRGDWASTPDSLVCAGNTLFFPANDGITGLELWKSDGTTAGTVLVKDIAAAQSYSSPHQIVAVGNRIFFGATSTSLNQFWTSDGTPEGTVQLAQFRPGLPGVGVGDNYFYVQGGELWKSDGTVAGTGMVKNINPASGSFPKQLTAWAGRLFFFADDGAHGFQLWRSDGTEDGTQMVSALGAGTATSFGPMQGSGGRFFFTPTTELGRELWSTDGTEAQTSLVTDIHTGTAGSAPTLLTPFDHRVYFATTSGLWVSDGTAAGTIQVSAGVPLRMAAGADAVYAAMSAPGDGLGVELYKIFGQPPVAQLVKDIYPGASSSSPENFVTANGITYFTATDPTSGKELWRSDGTPDGTWMVADMSNSSSNIDKLIEMDGKLFFTAFNGINSGIYRSDGTRTGTVRIKQIGGSGNPGTTTPFAVMNHNFYFAAGSVPLELWKSNGTSEGTVRVGTIDPDRRFLDVVGLMAHNGRLYFRMLNSTLTRIEAWTSDGTLTTRLRDLVGEIDFSPGDFVPFGNKVAFLTGQVGFGGPGLWLTDATPEGTSQVELGGGFRQLLTNGQLLFITTNDSSTRMSHLWRSDGTAEGTAEVRHLATDNFVFSATNFAVMDGVLYFSASTPAIGAELWKVAPPIAAAGGTYSTAAGRSIVLDGSSSSDPDPAETLQYLWDLDSDGIFGETGSAASRGNETGPTPTFSAIDLIPGSWPIALRVVNTIGLISESAAQITITPPSFITLSADAVTQWSGGPGARVLTLHGGSLTLADDISSVYPGISIVADNAATVHLPAVQHINQLTLLDNATLNLMSASLFLSAPQPQEVLANIRSLLKSGGIFSSAVQLDSRLGIGYAVDPASGSVRVTATVLGDLNLDRTVSIADFIALAANFGRGDAAWPDGDLNDDQAVSIADFITLASNFGQSYPGAAAPAAAASSNAAIRATKAAPAKSRLQIKTHMKQRGHHPRPQLRRWLVSQRFVRSE